MECVRQWPSLKLGCLGTNRMPRGSKLLEMPPDCLALADSGKSSCTSRLLTPCLNVTGRVYNALRAASHTAVLSYTRLLSFLNCEQKGAALFSSHGPDICAAASRCTVYLSFVFFFSAIDEHLPDVREANESTCRVSYKISPFAIFGNFSGAVEFSWETNTAIRIWFRFGSLECCRLESFVVRRIVRSRKRSVI